MIVEQKPVLIYTLEMCPNCDLLKERLKFYGILYDEYELQTPESIAELRFNGCFSTEAPILCYFSPVGLEIYEYKEITDEILTKIKYGL